MSYQGGSLLASQTSNHEEDYGTDAIHGHANSARGEGTTTNELMAKFRFLNVSACTFVLLFHTLPVILNPVRLTILLASPIRLILELIIAFLALTLLMIEGRIPMLGEKALLFVRNLFGGRVILDLDSADGRVCALTIMMVSMVLINYLTISKSAGDAGGGGVANGGSGNEVVSDVAVDDGGIDTNTTAIDGNFTTPTSISDTEPLVTTAFNTTFSILYIILQCIIVSPTIWVLASLSMYTIYTMRSFPEYARIRGYPNILPGSSAGGNRNNSDSNYNIHGRTGDGYQSVPTPSWAQGVVNA